MSTVLLELQNVWREYRSGDTTFAALKDVDLRIDAGEMVAIVGASGSGKSSLMNILGCLDRPTRGDYRVEGRSTADLSADDLTAAEWPLARPPHLLETSVPGIFAVGDVRAGNVKRVASAVGEGSISVQLVHKALAGG